MRWSTAKFHQRAVKRRQRRQEWHLWFAWFPVRMDSDYFSFRWLEMVYRKQVGMAYCIYDDVEKIRLKVSCQKVSDEILEEDKNINKKGAV